MLTAARGVIVAEFFDSGESRVLPWARRPQAAALVAQLADPDRGWDAIVVGEYERVDWHAEDHEQTMLALGLSSKREVTRIRIRVRTAMAAQTLEPAPFPEQAAQVFA
jgi:site-specific DNA recombinase